MDEQATFNTIDLLDLTSEIVSAYVSNNKVEVEKLSEVIAGVYASLSSIASEDTVEMIEPAVPIKKSVTPDYIICLEDGKKFKMLRRHLLNVYGLTPEQYRERWGLPADYPMVAPNYAEKRSGLAKQIGLGKK